MVEGLRWKFTIVLLLAVAGLYIIVPPSVLPNKPILKDVKYHLGIDLQGGAELRYRLLHDNKGNPQSMLQEALSVIHFRIKNKSLKEPIITSHGDDEIIIQIPGVDAEGIKEYRELMKRIGKLELGRVGSKEIHDNYPDDTQPAPAGYKWIVNTEKKADHEYANRKKILIKEEPIATGKNIVRDGTQPSQDFGGNWIVEFMLNEDGAAEFKKATSELKDKGYIAIIMDNELISRPIVRGVIAERGQISGGFQNKDEALRLAIILRSGSLPAPLGRMVNGTWETGVPESETFVGSTIGHDSIIRGRNAIIAAFVLVMLFMIIYYRGGGVVAVIAVFLNLIYLLLAMAVFGATLTLPGIAGILLTVGMAVDGNILILERIREEKDKGKSPVQAFESAYQRVYLTIMDANITTLVAGIVLYIFGTGAVQGFAITLAIGIVTTIFTVTFCTKVITRMMLHGGLIKNFSMMRMFQKPNINFTRIARPMIVLSVILIAFSVYFFFKDTKSILGIDFSGGTMLTMEFDESRDISQVRQEIDSIQEHGKPKYSGAIVQPVFKSDQGLITTGQGKASTFQIRVGSNQSNDPERLKKDFTAKFDLRPPYADLPDDLKEKNDLDPYYNGAGFLLYMRNQPPVDVPAVSGKITAALKERVGFDPNDPDKTPLIRIDKVDSLSNQKYAVLRVLVTPKDANKLKDIKEDIGRLRDKIPTTKDPFSHVGVVGPQVVQELTSSTIQALFWSWVLIILYVGYRFTSWKFGVVAVLALIHDAIIAIGAVAVCAHLVPRELGLNFEINLNTVAAILTIIGYSVNDTIVTFDRIRENLPLMKRESFRDIINVSINQTLSRTILTSLSVWLSVIALYFLTLKGGTGIETFAFPMIVGIIVGTYSTIYIAGPILVGWYKGGKPQGK